MDMFSTRTMLRALEQMKKAKTFLCTMIFNTIETVASEYVDIDIQKGTRRIGAYVSPLLEGKVVDRQGWETKTFKPPYIKMKMPTTAQDFLKRNIGETVYGASDTPASRAAKQLGKDLMELDEMIVRMEEIQCAQALQEGKVTCVGEGVNAVIDFGMSSEAKPVLTGTDRWSDHINADPINDLSVWHEEFAQRSGRVAPMAIFGYDAMRNFLNCEKAQTKLDNRRIMMGEIKPEPLNEMGVKYWGHLDEPGIDVYTYSEWYFDPIAKVEKPLIQSDKVIMVDPTARLVRHYAMIQDLKATAVVPRFPKSWETEDPSTRWVMLQSAPLCAPHQIDAITCATVL
jgi:hypothetical protein